MKLTAAFLKDPDLRAVLAMLSGAGHRALIVGGAVRNALLGKPASDIDISTDARPEQVMALAQKSGLRSLPTGIEHGTITLLSGTQSFEITTFRRDVETDGRRAVVAFADRLEEDALRRDFTMNALYAEADGTIIDPVGGVPDLEARRLRFIGSPDDRIREDYLRILRFFRFHAQYGALGAADPAALAACARHRDGLAQLSAERIGAEMRKLLGADDPGGAVALMDKAGILGQVIPDATPQRLLALLTIEQNDRVAGPIWWMARLAALTQQDVSEALRLSRSEARDHAQLRRAMYEDWDFYRIAYYLAPPLADAAAALVQTRDAARGAPPEVVLRPGWDAARLAAAHHPLPISAADLMPELTGPALGAGLKAAEEAWIAARFTLPPSALIAAAKNAKG